MIPAFTIWCSTPFGITDYIGTLLPLCHWVEILSAQRLSASRIISERAGGGDGAQRRRVLNAFRHHGLYRIDVDHRLRAHRPVLNAFRHHGLYRCSARRSMAASASGAQRLSASRIISASAHAATKARTRGAQRLSASRIISVVGRPFARIDRRVLNAFRHHGLYRCRQPAGSLPQVCAQRLSASRIISAARTALGLDDSDKCSTPFGITDYIGWSSTSGCRWRARCAQRLSASRIISVTIAIVRRFGGVRCSTPFGITDYIGLWLTAPRTRRSPCAQRLSASRIISGL